MVTLEVIKKICEVGYGKLSGLCITKVEEGLVEGEVKIRAHHMNPIGTVHGGLMFTLADIVGGVVVRTMGGVSTTCSTTINFLRPAMDVKKIIAKGHIIKNGKDMVVVQVDIFTDEDVHCATVMGNYKRLSNISI